MLALGYLHSQNVVYRDLKPENILLSKEGHLILTDFGFAKWIPSGLTSTLCGTPEYIAPEIIRGNEYGIGADWYSLGIFIYEMLVGQPPFSEASVSNLYKKILEATWYFPPELDPLAVDLIQRLCSSDPTQRLGALVGKHFDVMKHPWFKEVDWNSIFYKKQIPPFVPKLTSPADTSYFELYEESLILIPHNKDSCDTRNFLYPEWDFFKSTSTNM